MRLQKLVKKNGKKVDKEITSILKEFAEILIHGEKVSDQYFEYSMIGLFYIIVVSFWKKECSVISSILYFRRNTNKNISIIQRKIV